MADTKITVDIDLQDDLTPKINEIKKALDSVEGAHPGGVKGGIGDIGKGARAAGEEVGFLAGQFKELGAGIGYSIGAWNVGFMLAAKAIEFVGDAFKNAANLQQGFIEQQNLTRSSTEQQEVAFERLKKSADEAGMSLGDDFQKFVLPTTQTLETLGLTEEQAGEETKVLGQYMRAFGVDMRDLATKVELGTANFGDLLKAGNALDPMLGREILAWQKWAIAEQQAMLGLQRSRQLMNDAAQDTQRLASAHENFAQSTGLGATAFQAFQQRVGTRTPLATRFQIPEELTRLAPGAYWDFNRLAAEQQKRLQEGVEQIAKEENLPIRTVQLGVRAGLPGYGNQELLAAAGRRREEGEITRHRGEQADDFERANAAQQERIKLNNQVKGILKEEVQYQDQINQRMEAYNRYAKSINAETKSIADNIAKTGTNIGDVLNLMDKWSKTPYAPVPYAPGQPQLESPNWLDPKVREQWLNLQKQGITGTTPASPEAFKKWMEQTGKTPAWATESTLMDLGKKFEDVARLLTGVLSGG